MIKRQQKKYGWEFIFVGANIDAYAEAQRFGIRKDRAVNYVHDGLGTKRLYGGLSMAVCSVMSAPAGCASDALDECDWEEDIAADFEERGRK